MLRLFIQVLLMFIFIPVTGFGQFRLELTQTSQSGLPVAQTVYYHERQLLSWNDFNGRASYEGRTAALTVSGFGYKASMGYTGTNGSMQVKVFCYFDKAKSWARSDKKNDYILNHEQRHFDLSFIASARFMQRLRDADFKPETANKTLQQIYEEAQAGLTVLQHSYDEETQNGLDRNAQQRWNEKIDAWLLAIKP